MAKKKSKVKSAAVRPAETTIEAVFEEFLAEQRKRLKPATVRKYEAVIDLFGHSLNGYAYQNLNTQESALFEKLYNAKGKAQREFCQIFGPEKIPENVSEFLNYFMIRKVMCGKELKKTAGTVTKKLSQWLLEKGYITPDSAADMADSGAAAVDELPAAEEFLELLEDHIDQTVDAFACEDVIEDHFSIDLVAPGKLRISGMMADAGVTITVPRHVSEACRAGWTFSGTIGKAGRRWMILEVWNVYP